MNRACSDNWYKARDCKENGMSTPLQDAVTASGKIAATRSRNKKIHTLAGCLATADAEDIAVLTAWLSGILPQGRIGLGPAILREVAATPAAVSSELTVADVNRTIDDIAATTGKGSQAARRQQLEKLLQAMTATQQHFMLRLLSGELRQGALQGIMTEAIATAAGVDAAKVRRASMLSGDVAAVAAAALTEGEHRLDDFRLQVGRPLQPMLAQTADDLETALATLGEAIFDYKMDGARVQVHRQGQQVRVYTRQLNDVSARLPEVVEAALSLPADQLILDGEVLALRDDGRPHPFQVTMQRFGRSSGIVDSARQLPLSVFFFDLIYHQQDLTLTPALDRFARMRELLPAELLIPRVHTDQHSIAQGHLDDALAAGHEGVMAKHPQSLYEAGSRGAGWLKIKPAHTLDLVIIAAEWGSGRRKGWLSNLHLAAFDTDTQEFVMLGKTFKGLSDAMLAWQTQQLLQLETGRQQQVVHVRPELVVEIAFNELQRSRQYPGGMALRFARVKAYRPDKSARQADTLATVRRIFENQYG